MKIAKVCIGDPFVSGKGDSKLIRERVRVLWEKERDVELIIFSAGLRGHVTRVGRKLLDRGDVSIISVQFSVRRILSSVRRLRIRELWNLPLQTWFSFALAECYRTSSLDVLKGYQIVHIYHIRCLGLCDLVDKEDQSLVLDCIDSYTLNMSSRNALNVNRIKGLCLQWELERITRIESNLSVYLGQWKSARLITVSNIDLRFFKGIGGRGAVVPVGIQMDDMELYALSPLGAELRCIFFGNLDYDPNISAVNEVMNVARLLQKEDSSLRNAIRFTVAGRSISNHLRARLSRTGVQVVSPVNDMRDLVRRHDIAILPMVSGSGMQSKVLEAIAWGKLVIATARCADPVGLEDGIHYIKAESSGEIISCLRSLAEKRIDTGEMRKAAYSRIEAFKWETTVSLLDSIYSSASNELLN